MKIVPDNSPPLPGNHRWNYQIKIMLGTLAALIVADGIISRFLIENRFAIEGNPFLQDFVGRDSFLYIKAAGAILATLLLWLIFKRKPRLSLAVTLSFILVYTAIVGWSLWIFYLFHFL